MTREADEFYSGGSYARLHPDWHARDSAWKAANVRRLLERNGLRPASVVDVGCGAGGVIQALREGFAWPAEFVGYDIAPEPLEAARALGLSDVEWRLGRPGDDARRFDLLLLLDVVEHVENPWAFLRGLLPRARHFALHLPLDLSAQAVLRERPIMDARNDVGHLHFYTRSVALRVLEEAGLEVLDCFYTRGAEELARAGWPLRTRAANLLRRALFRMSPDLTARLLGGYSLMVLAAPRSASSSS